MLANSNYFYQHLGRWDRQIKLHEQWYFICDCLRCADQSEFGTWSSSIMCPKCNEANVNGSNAVANALVMNLLMSQPSQQVASRIHCLEETSDSLYHCGTCQYRYYDCYNKSFIG